ncbi:hypothetical protein AV521_45985 [Streptomyces sp. IMTB 2501]|uniref:DUF5988 family protein n=1 Tax=Streptomyces sp. IMTB 2501 TaxID=1776340 RepID=UPI00096BE64C|nr:DUF5988 family protein [Streptomyces sp. IMTB 2501]OLZ59174.1 hypothetical protein AV521_45985 [Streptomyces sp. IMTB 2501]
MNTVQPNVILQGGTSPYLPDDQRVLYVQHPDTKLKILRGNRHEHFEPTSETVLHQGVALQVFVWSGSTKVAE